MSTTHDPDISATRAWHADGRIHVLLADGHELSFPADITPRLAAGTPEQRNRIEILPFTLHWPDLDEDIALESILRAS